MTSSPVLDIPFRKATSLKLSDAIKQYISTKYDQHPDMFSSDLATIDQLRADAVNVQEVHVSGIHKLARYAGHLQWISGKFPIDIGANFTWYPALGYNTSKPVTQNNLQFERSNVLYNLAALYSRLAAQSPRNNALGLKAACNYFCASAGTLKYLKEEVITKLRSTPPEDMDAMTLECLEQLMLAQAQECFWLKAVIDGNKDSVVARLAASVSDYYDNCAEFGHNSSSITSEWVHHMAAKHHHFSAAAQYRASRDCLSKSKYGEEVARLMDALSAADGALKVHGRYLNSVVKGDLIGLKEKVAETLKGAEKDNDLIYLNPVPPPSALPKLSRASMVSPKIPKEISEATAFISETGPYGAPLFAKLVPFAVHVAASIYSERRDRLVNDKIIDELEALTAKLHNLLQSLNLPGSLQALEKPLGLPPGIIAHADEIRQQGGVDKLLASVEDIKTLKANDLAMYQEAVEILRSEAEEDNNARMKHGTDRWMRPPSEIAAARNMAQVTEYEGILKSAGESDQLVAGKLAEAEPMIRLLGGRMHDLEDFVPNSSRTKLTPKMDREVGKLRQCLNEVSRLESRRRRKIEAIRQTAKSDDIKASTILIEAARLERENPIRKVETVDFEPLFQSRLESRYGNEQSIVEEESEAQAELVSRLEEANASFLACRRVDSSIKEREDALQKLENAYFKYSELMGNFETGKKFYNDLAKLLHRFRDECKHFVYQRRVEAGQLEVGITNDMHNLRISNAGVPSPAQIPQQQHAHHQQQRLAEPTKLTTAPALPAPTPGLWRGDATTAIKFAGGPPKR